MTVFRTLAVAGVTAATAATLLPGIAAAATPPPAPTGATFVPVAPKRVLDTREGNGPVGPEKFVTLDFKQLVPANASAVVFNLTGTNPTEATSVRATPTLAGDSSGSSNLNLAPGETRANLVTVTLGQGAPWQGEVELVNHAGNVDLIADLAGYYVNDTSGARFTAGTPQRVLDTRLQGGPVGANGTVTVDLSSVVPSTTTAVVFNLTGTDTTGSTVVTAWPHGTKQPTASNLNLEPGDTRPNLVTVAVGPDRKVDLNNHVGSVNLIVDLAGYYATDRGDPFFTVSPVRTMDTRASTSFGPGESRALNLSPWLPASANTVVYNLTATNPTAATFVTGYPAGTTVPNTSNLNLVAGQTAPNLAITPLGVGGQLALRNNAGRVDLITDIAGYFGSAPGPCDNSPCWYGWGGNDYGQLGDGTTVTYSSRAVGQVAGLASVKQVAGGMDAGYALRADGTVWMTGRSGETNQHSPQPTQVRGLNGVSSIAAGWREGFAVKSDGTVWTWTGPQDAHQVGGLSNITQLASGARTHYALRNDGTVWAWGDGTNGALGVSVASAPNPIQVPVPGRITAITGSSQSGYALREDGTVWAWGSNWDGELGVGSTEHVVVQPTQVSGLTSVTRIAAARADAAYAIKSDGTLWSWGSVFLGGREFTSGGPYEQRTPAQVPGLSNVTDVADGGWQYGLALTGDGTVWIWGSTTGAGHVVAPGMSLRYTPTKVPGLDGVRVSRVIGAGNHAYLLATPS
ncbi:RCC1 domain-containing protein [Kutzneria sp. NPDC052558]|uniref:RCC1 domain-containing protein n=1 Tax=Kutzneria sp. NPDC052558 TaxID=3364121 RepID=UPI0037C5BE44